MNTKPSPIGAFPVSTEGAVSKVSSIGMFAVAFVSAFAAFYLIVSGGVV